MIGGILEALKELKKNCYLDIVSLVLRKLFSLVWKEIVFLTKKVI